MAATAVSELSFDPPSMLICVNRTASLYAPLSAGAPFAINILHHSQRDVAANCSGLLKGEARFGIGDWPETDLGAPRLGAAQASIVCRTTKQVDYGTHGIFIGDVAEVYMEGVAEPLVYVDGRYTRAMDGDVLPV